MTDSMLDDMEFEQKLNDLGDNQTELIRFIARQQFSSSKIIISHNKRIKVIEEGNKRTSTITGGISGAVTAAIIGVIDYFSRK